MPTVSAYPGDEREMEYLVAGDERAREDTLSQDSLARETIGRDGGVDDVKVGNGPNAGKGAGRQACHNECRGAKESVHIAWRLERIL